MTYQKKIDNLNRFKKKNRDLIMKEVAQKSLIEKHENQIYRMRMELSEHEKEWEKISQLFVEEIRSLEERIKIADEEKNKLKKTQTEVIEVMHMTITEQAQEYVRKETERIVQAEKIKFIERLEEVKETYGTIVEKKKKTLKREMDEELRIRETKLNKTWKEYLTEHYLQVMKEGIMVQKHCRKRHPYSCRLWYDDSVKTFYWKKYYGFWI